MKKEVLVINYHRIETDKDASGFSESGVFNVSDTDFYKQIRTISSLKIPVVSLMDIVTNSLTAPFSIAITFDDGNSSDLDVAYPLLKSLHYPATFFIPATQTAMQAEPAIVHQLEADNYTIGSHGISHKPLTMMNKKEIVQELESSRKILQEKYNVSVDFFSLPHGCFNHPIKKMALNAGYKAICTTEARSFTVSKNRFLIHRWSIKHDTSLKQFKRMLNAPLYRKYTSLIAPCSRIIVQWLGVSLSGKLNALIHPSR